MRISRLNLLRYGKFTDRVVDLPHSKPDFHLIVGPNEAGKSTLRSAILDLFFGIETRSPYNFLHTHSEMRLGAAIGHEGKTLEFHRTKARKQTLFSPDGVAISDDSLFPFLGNSDRLFFDQMFGLDHEKLVSGGNAILNSSSDIGQILFQSAAGIGSLGAVRDALQEEADKLWAPRKSAGRDYYEANDAFISAKASLEQVSIRTKDWTEASADVELLAGEFGKAKQQHGELEFRRIKLERIRRVAPSLNALQEIESAINEIGETVSLPTNAAKQLADAELELARAEQEYLLLEKQTNEIAQCLKSIHPNETLLDCESDIQALSERRQQVRNHENDIVKRQEEINGHWKTIESVIRQLGWPSEEEEVLERRLPVLPVRTAMATLLKRYGMLEQARTLSKQAVRDKKNDIQTFDTQISALPNTSVSASLRSSLVKARNLGDVETHDRRLQSQLTKAARELTTVSAALGQWNFDIDTLRTLDVPSVAETDKFLKRLAQLETNTNALAEELASTKSSIALKEIEAGQYRNTHHPVTLQELKDARVLRESVWSSIKLGITSALASATDYETKVQLADDVADSRHDKAQEVIELQAKLDEVERLKQKAREMEGRIEKLNMETHAIQNSWSGLIKKTGLSEMSLSAIDSWRSAREKVLSAADAVNDARLVSEEFTETVKHTKATLMEAMRAEGVVADATNQLSTLIIAAADVVDSVILAKARLEEMKNQRHLASAAMAGLEEKATTCEEELLIWDISWKKNLALAGLERDTDVGLAEGALALFSEVEEKLRAIRELRTARIKTMQRDLSDFREEAQLMVNAVAHDLEGQSAEVVAMALTTRLTDAKRDKGEYVRLSNELSEKKKSLASASARKDSANAEIHPLLTQANAADRDELRAAITRSDRLRTLNDKAAAAKDAALREGDGLKLEALKTELFSADPSQIPVLLGEIGQQREEVQSQQNLLAAAHANATTKLSKITGQDEAARAESRRQDALARMANSAERYIKVFIAGKLLKWAIDRYRETKQGPMLARAGEIFSKLTLGSFSKLAVDFDCEPPALEGQRKGGQMVTIPAMSDGTRDQLYLALRLAALELHLGQTQALPFIADDLFINYDDARAKAGLEALANLAGRTQVVFLSHHDHMVPMVREVFGKDVNVVYLERA